MHKEAMKLTVHKKVDIKRIEIRSHLGTVLSLDGPDVVMNQRQFSVFSRAVDIVLGDIIFSLNVEVTRTDTRNEFLIVHLYPVLENMRSQKHNTAPYTYFVCCHIAFYQVAVIIE